jgi:peptidoglycan-associated lipoprotein
MKNPILLAVGVVGFLSLAACHKAVPVASRPEAPVPVAAAAPKEAPTPAPRPAAVKVTPTQQPAEAKRSAGLTPQERITLNERLAHLEDAMFDFDKYTIRSDATTALKDDVDVIRGILSNYPAQKLLIEGHADERGSSEYNMALGDKRARAANDFLATMGIPSNQLTVISYGKDHPVCTEQTEACWQKNRRAHITAAR